MQARITPYTGETFIVTTDHAASSYGIPVVTDADGNVLDARRVSDGRYNEEYYLSPADDAADILYGKLDAAAGMAEIRGDSTAADMLRCMSSKRAYKPGLRS